MDGGGGGAAAAATDWAGGTGVDGVLKANGGAGVADDALKANGIVNGLSFGWVT